MTRIIKITAHDLDIFLYYNTKRPYWKKKGLGIIKANTTVIFDNLFLLTDFSRWFYREGREDSDLLSLEKYKGFERL